MADALPLMGFLGESVEGEEGAGVAAGAGAADEFLGGASGALEDAEVGEPV